MVIELLKQGFELAGEVERLAAARHLREDRGVEVPQQVPGVEVRPPQEAREDLGLAARQAEAEGVPEVLRRLVALVDDQYVVRPQDLAAPDREVRGEQGVVDHEDLRRRGALPGAHVPTLLIEGAVLAYALLDAGVVHPRTVHGSRHVCVLGGVEPVLEGGEVRRGHVGCRRRRGELAPPEVTRVVPFAFEYGVRARPHDARDVREVEVHELRLERLLGRRDDDALVRERRREAVGEGVVRDREVGEQETVVSVEREARVVPVADGLHAEAGTAHVLDLRSSLGHLPGDPQGDLVDVPADEEAVVGHAADDLGPVSDAKAKRPRHEGDVFGELCAHLHDLVGVAREVPVGVEKPGEHLATYGGGTEPVGVRDTHPRCHHLPQRREEGILPRLLREPRRGALAPGQDEMVGRARTIPDHAHVESEACGLVSARELDLGVGLRDRHYVEHLRPVAEPGAEEVRRDRLRPRAAPEALDARSLDLFVEVLLRPRPAEVVGERHVPHLSVYGVHESEDVGVVADPRRAFVGHDAVERAEPTRRREHGPGFAVRSEE